HPSESLNALFFGRPPETCERSLGGGNGASRILLVRQCDSGDHLAVGRVDNIHEFATMRFDEGSIDIVRRDCFNRVCPGDRFQRSHSVSPCMIFYSQNEVTTARVSEPSFNTA